MANKKRTLTTRPVIANHVSRSIHFEVAAEHDMAVVSVEHFFECVLNWIRRDVVEDQQSLLRFCRKRCQLFGRGVVLGCKRLKSLWSGLQKCKRCYFVNQNVTACASLNRSG